MVASLLDVFVTKVGISGTCSSMLIRTGFPSLLLKSWNVGGMTGGCGGGGGTAGTTDSSMTVALVTDSALPVRTYEVKSEDNIIITTII